MGRVGRPPRLQVVTREQILPTPPTGSAKGTGSDDSNCQEDGEREQNNDFPTGCADSINATVLRSSIAQPDEPWNQWPIDITGDLNSPLFMDLDHLLTPVSEQTCDSMTGILSSNSPAEESLTQAMDIYLCPLDMSGPVLGNRSSRSSANEEIRNTATLATTREGIPQVPTKSASQTQQSDLISLSTTPKIKDFLGQLDLTWQRIISGTTGLHNELKRVAPLASLKPQNQCSCPLLMSRVQLLTNNPHLGPVRDGSPGRPGQSPQNPLSYPLDLFFFLDEVVYQAVSSVLFCVQCGKNNRVRLILYMHVDWLVDLTRQVLETSLSRLLSTSGSTTGDEAPWGKIQGDQADSQGATGSWVENDCYFLQVGSFKLEGLDWQICVRDLLKHRLFRMCRIFQRRSGDCGDPRLLTCLRASMWLRMQESILAEIRTKIETLLGMLEMCMVDQRYTL